MLTLGDVLAQRDLRLSLVAGKEEEDSKRRIAGAHSIEIDDPVRWLEPDWILLTTGLRLHDDPRRQRQLVLDAADAGLAAIGFGQHDTDAVPPEMLKAATSAGFPIFTVPYDVSLRLVATFVTSALTDARVLAMRRAEAAQAFLIDSLSETRPAEALVHRLGQLLDARVAFFTPDGQREMASDDAPPDSIWSHLGDHQSEFHEVQIPDGATVFWAPVRGEDYIYGWLAVMVRQGQPPTPLARQVTRNAQHLLAVPFQARLTVVEEERAARASLLLAAVDQSDEAGLEDLAAKMAALGLDFQEPAWLCASRDAAARGEQRQASLAALELRLRSARLPYLLGHRDDLVTYLVQAPEERIAEWAPSSVNAPVGISRGVKSVADLPGALREAQLALLHAERATSGDHLCRFEAVGLAERLLMDRSRSARLRDVDGAVAKIRDRPELYETMVKYLMADLDINRTAEQMHLHPNSVRYRLRRIEELVGEPLTHVPVLVDLYLGVLWDSLAPFPEGPR